MCLNQARYGISWGVLGAARACFVEALSFSKDRGVFGKPIASFQLIQSKLATMATEITKGQLLAYRLGQLKDQRKDHFSQTSMAKQNNTMIALDVARTARDILGASGIVDDFNVGRHMCNLESVYTYEGTNDIHILILGEALTRIPAYS